jgi:predicted transcriptional regulator
MAMGSVAGYRGEGYKKIVERIGLSINKAADFLGYSRRQSKRIASGTAETSVATTMLIKVMLEMGLTFDAVNVIAGRKPGVVKKAKKKAKAKA